MTQYDVLNSPFNIETHKKTFVNYLEVIILPDGTVEYAIPSHQEKLISVCIERDGITRPELCDKCPPEYYCDFTKWLSLYSGCVSVWNNFIMGNPNDLQAQALAELKNNGLYHGPSPSNTY